MSKFYISYTRSDRDWAVWIAQELEKLGHTPHIYEWEISAGGNIVAWMEKRLDEVDHIICVVSRGYLNKDYSSWERQSAQWAAVSDRWNFALPVYVQDCKPPMLLAPFKRCDLYGIGEAEAAKRLAEYLKPASRPEGPIVFPGQSEVFFPGRKTSSENKFREASKFRSFCRTGSEKRTALEDHSPRALRRLRKGVPGLSPLNAAL